MEGQTKRTGILYERVSSWHLGKEAEHFADSMHHAAAVFARGTVGVKTPVDNRPHLTARAIFHTADVLAMGRLRNERRAGFSHDQSEITDERQLAWWRTNAARLNAWLYRDGAGATVGYGLLRQEDDGRWYSSLAVATGHEGHGYGRTILADLLGRVDHDVWATARNDNPAAQKLHDPLFWDVLGCDDSLTYYRTRPKVRTETVPFSLDGCADEGWCGDD